MGNPETELKYQCKIFNVWEEKVPLPNGKTVQQSWIDHKPTVTVVPINDKNEILLIKQYRNAVKKKLWEIPAGTMDNGEESPVDCAQRELAEETGYKAKTFIKLFEGYLLPGYCNEYMHFFLARDLYYEPLTPDEDEFIEVIPVTFAKAEELRKNGDITDAKTALGILLAENILIPSSFQIVKS
jgi:ADP-ribose pyrophosphatase